MDGLLAVARVAGVVAAAVVAAAGEVIMAISSRYPHKVHVTCGLAMFRTKYNQLEPDQELPDVVESIPGRVTSVRKQGSKLIFITIESIGEQTTLQIMGRRDDYVGDFKALRQLSIKDWVFVTGFPAKSAKGELSIVPHKVEVVAPCLHQLPSVKGGEVGVEVRYREPWLGMLTGSPLAHNLIVRHRVVSYIRRFLDDQGFLEVETPILTTASGAAAKPFVTHHNHLGLDMHLRISPELYLKMLVVGGFERVYELGKVFRNEGLDQTHNPEFTMVEWYMAYADWEDMIAMIECLLSGIVKAIKGVPTVTYGGVAIDFTPPYRRIPVVEGLEEALGLKLPPPNTYGTEEARVFFVKLLADKGFVCLPPQTVTRMIDTLIGELLESQATDRPVIITEHPQVMSPLAKDHRSKPGVTERFEVFVAGKELVNAYTEQNDPTKQRAAFEAQTRDRAAGDDEAHGMSEVSEHFLRAQEYGLPPTGGLGLGLDRLIMFITDSVNIKNVIAFPPMRPCAQDE